MLLELNKGQESQEPSQALPLNKLKNTGSNFGNLK
jgi:hypothetical protein